MTPREVGYSPRIEAASSPSAQGVRSKAILGVLFHGSRSGTDNDTQEEYEATVRYALAGAGGLAWHATVGDDVIAEHLTPDCWGYHAREYSEQWIGIEFAQARVGTPISDAQIRAAVWYLRSRFPGLDLTRFAFHSETPPGIRDGKTDPAPFNSPELEALRGRILAAL